MKIGIDARLWNETGVGRYIRNLVTNLQEIDHTNEYVLFVKNNDEVLPFIHSSKITLHETDIRWHSMKEQLLFSQVLNNASVDIMHFPYFSLPITYRKPFVVTIHDLIIHHFSTGNASTLPLPLYQLKRLGFKRVFRHALNTSKKIIVPLNTVKEELESSFTIPAEKIIVTHEGFDPTLISSKQVSVEVKKEVEKGKYFLYVGNAYPHKNVGFLLEAFFEFSLQHPEYRLILVGKKDYFYQQLRAAVSSKSVTLLHDVNDSDLGYLYTWAECFVSASLMEGFGLPPLEAMGSSCLLLLSDIPAFREVCNDTPIYFHPHEKKT